MTAASLQALIDELDADRDRYRNQPPPRHQPPRCVKCSKWVPMSSLGAKVLSDEHSDWCVDLTQCPRCGLQEVRWW